jgi:membrane protease YdiL (CAAX protease family)
MSRCEWLLISVLGVYLIATALFAFTGNFAPAVASSPPAIAEFVVTLPGALMEELLFRGLILIAMLIAWGRTPRGVAKSVVVSSLMFGATHMINVLVRPAGIVLFQALVVSLPGIVYGALLLKTRSLWPAILIHWLTNAAVNVKVVALADWQETPSMWLWHALFLIPTTVYAVYLLSTMPVGEPDEDGEDVQVTRMAGAVG